MSMQTSRRVTIKFSSKGLHSDSGTDSCVTNDSESDMMVKVPGSAGCNKCTAEFVLDSCKLARGKMDQITDSCVTSDSVSDMMMKVPASIGGNKRKPEPMLDSQRLKRRKMDRGMKLKCGQILKELTMHRFGRIFSEPVDPVALNIPDYFDIISEPMDLGTIKSKLENNEYSSPKEFASDVNLTFSNAMRYNPPGNFVNQMAKMLDSMFRRRWKVLVDEWNHGTAGVEQGIIQNESRKYANDKAKAHSERSSLNAANEVKKSMTLEGKKKLWKELTNMLGGKMPEKLRNILQNSNLIGLIEGKINFDISACDESTWLELSKLLKHIKAAKVVPEKTAYTGRCLLPGKIARKGPSGSVDGKPPMSLNSSRCNSCGGMRCHCGKQTKSGYSSSKEKSFDGQCPAMRVEDVKKDLPTQATTSNLEVVQMDLPTHATTVNQDGLEEDLPTHATTLNLDVVKKDLPTHATTSGQDSSGFGRVMDEERTSTSPDNSPRLATATISEGWTRLDDQCSLEKAQRVAMLRSRFAETILKANGESDPKRLQEEKKRLERLQREEEAKIKALIEEQQLKVKMQLDMERQAARFAREMMERTFKVDGNLKSLKELEMLCGCPPTHNVYADCFRRRLQLIGLVLKDDFFEEEDEEAFLYGDSEEGEILANV